MTAPSVPRVGGVFDTRVDQVYSLCPEAERITDPNESTLPTPITEDTVLGWLEDLSAILSSQLPVYTTLPDLTQVGIEAAGRAVVANGVASYLEAARYPTGESTYAAVLWERYLTGAKDLIGRIADLLGIPDPGGDGTGVPVFKQPPPIGVFPPTYFVDGIAW